METIQLNGVNSIKGEIHSILTLMRVNTRWSNNSKYLIGGSVTHPDTYNAQKLDLEFDILDESPLAGPFRRLNKYLEGMYDIHKVDTVIYISPFHNIIVSEHASGPITCAALGSLIKFTSYGFLSSNFPRVKEGIALIANCIASCIFEESDWESDEVILMKLLELSNLIFRCDASKLLSVGAAWDVYSTCLSMHSQYRASKILKSEAESTLRHLTLTTFSQAHSAISMFSADAEEFNNVEENENGFSQIMRDKTWETASRNYPFSGPVGVPLLLGKIMTVLSNLMDLQSHSIPEVIFALTLVNIALEAGGSSLGSIPVLVDILRGDVCRHLLKASQSENLEVFSLALRVVFNLFMSIKDHVKIQLEVFLTSVHLRLLSPSNHSSSPLSLAREELALESLLEFCREPSLMQDLYTNYDCDVQCTNLFDSIVTTLCNRALPEGLTLSSKSNNHISEGDSLTFNSDIDLESLEKRSMISGTSIVNRLALDGLLSALSAISCRCESFAGKNDSNIKSSKLNKLKRLYPNSESDINSGLQTYDSSVSAENPESDIQNDSVVVLPPLASPSTPVRIRSNTQDEFKMSVDFSRSSFSFSLADSSPSSDNEDNSDIYKPDVDDDPDFVLLARAKTAEILRQRKLKKQKLRVAAEKFNANPMKIDWILFALEHGLISQSLNASGHLSQSSAQPNLNALLKAVNIRNSKGPSSSEVFQVTDPKSVSRFLRNTPGLGKTQIGEFISKGPADLYPFHASVLHEYVDTFEFNGKYCAFDKALRLFLGHFRLPGEAQCIDRLMEAFAGKFFKSLGSDCPFKTADSAFILAFSTIMLNTDLHNQQIPANKKMTKEQFVKNNRGINDGDDLPREYLENLYDQIKLNQIQVETDIADNSNSNVISPDFTDPATWDKLIKKRSSQNAPAAFTPTFAAREVANISAINRKSVSSFNYQNSNDINQNEKQRLVSARLLALSISHEKDMFLVMANQVFETLLVLWTFVEDDHAFNKLFDGTCDFIKICINLDLKSLFGGVINVLSSRSIYLMIYEKTRIEQSRISAVTNHNGSSSNQLLNLSPRQSNLYDISSGNKAASGWDEYYDTASLLAADEQNKKFKKKFGHNFHDSILLYKESLEQLLACKFDVLLLSATTPPILNYLTSVPSNVNIQLCVDNKSTLQSSQGSYKTITQQPNINYGGAGTMKPAISWQGCSTVRGELMLKLLLHFIEQYYNILPNDCWTSIITILLYARNRGVLPPPLASIHNSYDDLCSKNSVKLSLNLPLTRYAIYCLDEYDDNTNAQDVSLGSVQGGLSNNRIGVKSVSNVDNGYSNTTVPYGDATASKQVVSGSIWSTVTSLLWSNSSSSNANSNVSNDNTANSQLSDESRYHLSEDLVSLLQLSHVLSNKQPIPGFAHLSVYHVVDGNSNRQLSPSNVGLNHSNNGYSSSANQNSHSNYYYNHTVSSINNIYRLQSYDGDEMLRIVLFTSRIDQIILMSSSDSENDDFSSIIPTFFDALLKTLLELIHNIIYSSIGSFDIENHTDASSHVTSVTNTNVDTCVDNRLDGVTPSNDNSIDKHSNINRSDKAINLRNARIEGKISVNQRISFNNDDVHDTTSTILASTVAMELDAVMLLEWIVKIIQANSFLLSILWPKIHKSLLLLVFETDLSKIIIHCPYFLERCVVNVLSMASKLSLSSAADDLIWISLKLLNNIPESVSEELGGHVGAGVLSLLRISPGIAMLSQSVERWELVMSLLNISAVHPIGRVFAWEALNDIIDGNYVCDSNFSQVKKLVHKFLHGEFSVESSRFAVTVEASEKGNESTTILDKQFANKCYSWLPTIIMHQYKLTLMLICGLSTHRNAINEVCITLPAWPLIALDDNTNAENSNNEVLSSKIMYTANEEYKHVNKKLAKTDNYNSIYSVASKLQSMTSVSQYIPTHIAIKPIRLPNAVNNSLNDVEAVWLESCRILASLTDFKAARAVSSRAIYCLQGLLDVAKDSNLPPHIWSFVLIDLFDKLPLTLPLSLPYSHEHLRATSNHGTSGTLQNHVPSRGTTPQKLKSIVSDTSTPLIQTASTADQVQEDIETICYQCCNLVFELIVNHAKEIRTHLKEEFQLLWLQYLGKLAANVNQNTNKANRQNMPTLNNNLNGKDVLNVSNATISYNCSDYFRNEIIEMIAALLRLLQSNITVNKLQQSSNNKQNNDSKSFVKSSAVNAANGTSLSSSDTKKTPVKTKSTPGIFSFLNIFSGGDVNDEIQLTQPATTVAVQSASNDSNTSISSDTKLHDSTVENGSVVSETNGLVTSSADGNAPHADLPSNTLNSYSVTTSVFSPDFSSFTVENAKLLLTTWKTINSICPSFSTQLKHHNSILLSDLLKSIDDANYVILMTQSVQASPQHMIQPHPADQSTLVMSVSSIITDSESTREVNRSPSTKTPGRGIGTNYKSGHHKTSSSKIQTV